MTSCNKITPNTIISGSSVIQTYLRNGINLPVAGVDEYVVIETGAITGGTTKILETSTRGTTFKLESLWVDSSNDTQFAIDFDILWGNSSVFKFALNSNQLPFEFPPVIITDTLNISIKPQANIDRILCYAKPVAILERMIFL